jgi:hypothetical protein
MGFGYGTRTPYEVQQDNGGRFDFDKNKSNHCGVKGQTLMSDQ